MPANCTLKIGTKKPNMIFYYYQITTWFFQEIKENNLYLPVITNLVFSETVTLIRYKLGILPSIEFGKKLRESHEIKTIYVSEEKEEKAWKIFLKYSDKDFSFVDCTSFATMKDNKIKKAFTFDKHFQQFGFEIFPKQNQA